MRSFVKNTWPFSFGLVLGIYFISLTVTGDDLSFFPGDLGDARFNTYILEHVHKFFTGETKDFWSAPFMYPEPNVITYSDNLLGSAPFYSFFRLTGLSTLSSFQWWYLIMVILNYTCCYLFLQSVYRNRYAAVLGAMVFAFSLALHSQMTHAQTFPRYPVPLAFWMAVLFSRALKPFYFFAALFFVIYQFYCGIYLGFMLAIPITVFLLFVLIKNRDQVQVLQKIKQPKWMAAIAGSVASNILLLLPLMLPYLKRAGSVSPYDYAAVKNTLPTVCSYFFSHNGSLLWDFLSETGIAYKAWWDHQIYAGGIATLGILTFAAVVIVKVIKKDALQKVKLLSPEVGILVTAAITFLLYTRFNGFSFHQFLFEIPGYGSMRALQRIININLIFFSVGATFVFHHLLSGKKFSLWFFILFAGLIITDNYVPGEKIYRTEKSLAAERVKALMEKMEAIPENSVVSYEPEILKDPPYAYQLDAMLAGQSLNMNMINGYSATSPYGFDTFWNKMDEKSRNKWLKIKGVSPDAVYIIH